MATVDHARFDAETTDLQRLAKRHLWMHFTRMGAYGEADVPIIVRGDGCYVWDEKGNRYFDGLSALFCVNIGHGHTEVAQAGADQAHELDFFTTWSYAHPRAIELAAKIASLTPGDLNRIFFTSGGSEAVETAVKLARQYHKVTGNPNKHKIIAREIAYHGTTWERWRRPASPRCAIRSSRSCPAACMSRTRTCTGCPAGWRRGPGRDGRARDRVPGPGHGRGGDHGAGPERRRLLRAARGLLPARARDLRRVQRALHLRRGDLLVGPPGRVVGLPALRLPAGHHHHGQGHHHAPTRRWARRSSPTGSLSRSWRARPRSCTA